MQTSQEKRSQSAEHKHSSPQSKLLVITREFKAPVEKLFAAFADAESLKAWWWPKGMWADHVELDFREGGRLFINMRGYDQGGSGMTCQFEEIVPNERFVMTDQFANEKGQAITAQEAKMPGEWPEKGYITFEFESVDANTSRFILSQEGIPNEMHQDCIQGWSESFDKLDEFLGRSKH